jgi:predicted N-acetyltransferase YhbS
VVLPERLVLRPARPDDVDQVAALLADRGDAADAVDLRLVVSDPDEGLSSCAVVVDGTQVVSTATLLRETLVVGGVEVSAGQVELVATRPGYEGQGLVRALMQWAHERSRARGDLVQIMIGIPYFYRQFGYAYAIPMPRWRAVDAVPPSDPHVVVRRATPGDIPAMRSLQDAAQAPATVRMPHSAACWRWLVARDGSTQWVAERDGSAVATGRSTPPDEGGALGELAAADAPAALSLVNHVRSIASSELVVAERPGTLAGDAVEPFLVPAESRADWYYARIERLGPLLERLAPVLLSRLAAAGLADRTHEVLLSSFRSHVRFSIGPHGMSPVVEGGPLQAPGSAGGSGVPPDALAPLLFGPEGAAGLAARLPDCYLGRQGELMAALFPPVAADLLTFYLPV